MRFLPQLQKLVGIIAIAAALIFGISYFFQDRFPPPNQVLPELEKVPLQTETTAVKFNLKKNDLNYKITPVYDYELYGMVVSTSDNETWFSRFKKIDPLNAKDLCVVYGGNAKGGLYQNVDFYSQEFVCFYNILDRESSTQFSNVEISNNHLLTDEVKYKKIYDLIKNSKRGDQIHFKGYLANYDVEDNSGNNTGVGRNSSITRSDKGNGACETVFVTDFDLLRRANPEWSSIFDISKIILEGSVVIWLILFILGILAPTGFERKKEELPDFVPEHNELFSDDIAKNDLTIDKDNQ